MSEPQRFSRRTVLHSAWVTGVLTALGSAPFPVLAAQRQPPDLQAVPVQPALALSLTLLQQQVATLQRAQRPIPAQLAEMGGMTCIQGVMSEPDGELILLGSRDSALPRLHLDDLVVALRNAYQVNAAYDGVPGCTIDPWTGADDPWRIQRVAVTGMPPVSMAARHVAIDYALKKVSAGIVALAPGVTSLYALRRAADPLCAGQNNQDTPQTITHRFWFFPRYPAPPRFMQDAQLVLILRPVEVQLLTEQEFLNQAGQRQGAAPAAPVAQEFAQEVTQLLATMLRSDYARLVQDFRWIELGQLLRLRAVPASSLQYLLQDYPVPDVPVPAFVGGIRREERGEVMCDTQITEQRIPQGTRVASAEKVARYHYVSRGGVEANIRLTPTQFVPERSRVLARFRQQVRAARPTAQTIFWAL